MVLLTYRWKDGMTKMSTMTRLLTNGADDGNRTRVASLEDWGSTIELHPHIREGTSIGYTDRPATSHPRRHDVPQVPEPAFQPPISTFRTMSTSSSRDVMTP